MFSKQLHTASDRSPEAYLVSEGGTVLVDVFWLSVLTTLTSFKVFPGVARRLCHSQEVLNEFTDDRKWVSTVFVASSCVIHLCTCEQSLGSHMILRSLTVKTADSEKLIYLPKGMKLSNLGRACL